MSNTHTRIKKRREYLLKKGAAYTEFSIAFLLLVPCVFITIILFVGIGIIVFTGAVNTPEFDCCLVATFLFGWMTWILYRAACRAQRQANYLPYVPPVTTDTLPAEEVLVRGSVEPTQEQGKVLLRGTDGSAGAGEQELLRSSQGQDKN